MKKMSSEFIHELLADVGQLCPMPIIICNEKGRIDFANALFLDEFNMDKVFSQQGALCRYDYLKKDLFGCCPMCLEVIAQGINGQDTSYRLSLFPVGNLNKKEELYALFFSPVQVGSEEVEGSRYMFTHDYLTGLPNRQLLMDRIGQMLLVDSEKVIVCVINIDDFHYNNDFISYDYGDAILVDFAKVISQSFPVKATVSRTDGDEFVIAVINDDDIDYKSYMIELFERIKKQFCYENPGALTISVGITQSAFDGVGANELLVSANQAMREAKKIKGNSCIFSSKLENDRSKRMFSLYQNINKAFINNEFKLYFQPLVNIRTRQICGVETLTRWHSDELGQVSPVEFIPVIENISIVHDFGIWVIDQSCKLIHPLLNDLPEDFKLAVNVSPRQLLNSKFVDNLKTTLNNNRYPPDKLELEITEGVFIDDFDVFINQVRKIKILGVKLSIDDFGTGYSSLSYLKKIPFDTLKIDRSFVFDNNDDENRVLVKTIAKMAKCFGLSIIAEGVEKEDYLNFLQDIECDIAQGFLFSPAIDVNNLGIFIRKNGGRYE